MTVQRPRPRDAVALAGFLTVCAAISALGGAVTASSIASWYHALQKPSFNPPDWVFGPVWTALYLAIAVAGWRVWRKAGIAGARAAMACYALQLALNLAWSLLFFGSRWIGVALLEIVVLLVAIVANALLFRPIDRAAAWLLWPYAAWVTFAAVLNFSLWRLN